MLKFGQKEVTTKDFHGQRQITDLFMIDVNKLVVSDKVSCNNGKDCCYIVGYQIDGVLIPLSIKTTKTMLSYGVSQFDEKIWNEVESQLFEKMVTEPIKREGRYINGKLKTWKEHIKTNFHGQYVPHNMHCNATAVLKTDSLYKQDKNYHPQVYVEEFKYTNAENQQCSMLSDDDDDGFFEV